MDTVKESLDEGLAGGWLLPWSQYIAACSAFRSCFSAATGVQLPGVRSDKAKLLPDIFPMFNHRSILL